MGLTLMRSVMFYLGSSLSVRLLLLDEEAWAPPLSDEESQERVSGRGDALLVSLAPAELPGEYHHTSDLSFNIMEQKNCPAELSQPREL